MTTVQLLSDLHLEWGYQSLPGGDVLILSGDICEYRTLKKQFHSTKLLDRVPGSLNAYDFFYHECAKYKQVFYVLGNHEHYHNLCNTTVEDLRALMPENVTILEQDAVLYDSVLYVGATLWTDLNKGDPLTKFHLTSMMADYKVIKYYNPATRKYHKLSPNNTAYAHQKTLEYLRLVLENNKNVPVVVITHHAPSFASVSDYYRNDTIMNGGFASELSEFIIDHPNIIVWSHGHLHDPVNYMIGSTRVISNPRGYVGQEDTSKFDPNFTFEI